MTNILKMIANPQVRMQVIKEDVMDILYELLIQVREVLGGK